MATGQEIRSALSYLQGSIRTRDPRGNRRAINLRCSFGVGLSTEDSERQVFDFAVVGPAGFDLQPDRYERQHIDQLC
jgi:hypothetical protein